MNDSAHNGAYSDGDVDTNRSDNPTLGSLVEGRYSRRQTLLSSISATAAMFFGGMVLSACGGDDDAAPTVSAGQSGQSNSGRVVTLSGTASDNGSIGSASWSQVSGPSVTLTGANSSTATFLAPSVATSTPLVFRFTAADDKGKTSFADTTVTVNPATLGFDPVAKNLNDIVTVPAGYTVTVLYRTGDPLTASTPAYANDGSDTSFSARAGDQHDGMSYFGLAASGGTPDAVSNSRGLLVMNHENIVQDYLHPAGATNNPVRFSSTISTLVDNPAGARPTAEVVKEIEAHGVSVVEVTAGPNRNWTYVQNSALNRRITPFTEMAFSGPVKGNALLFTAFSTDGTKGRGTLNNCANGYTPWNTYTTCEENWAGYFRRERVGGVSDDDRRTAALGAKSVTAFNRYGLGMANIAPLGGAGQTRVGNFAWATAAPISAGDTRISKFNATVDATKPANGTGDFRNEPNQFGWVVEIDPYDPASTPRKRTALGRMNHEGCWPSIPAAGRRMAFYMGDDAQNEYLYKFVSATPWDAADAQTTNRLAIGDKYLDSGTLYVAKFNADGTGTWLPLVFGQGQLTSANATYAFADQADVLTHCRVAGDVLGATKMDRPEWTGINPRTGEVYLTLTNNSSRTLANTDPANPRFYNDPKGSAQTAQRGNPNGHIIRLRETGDNSEATTFTWDIFLFGAGSDLDATNINLSSLDATNDFSSPDGLWFSRPTNAGGQVNPLLWLQTDDGAYTDVTNNQMLVAIPGTVGDGGARTITNTDAGATRAQATIVGKAPGANLRRFLVGPKECEITGIDSTPDGRTLFVNVQHPGEGGTATAPTSNWPASQAGNAPATSRPRSATVVITKNDGGVVGL